MLIREYEYPVVVFDNNTELMIISDNTIPLPL